MSQLIEPMWFCAIHAPNVVASEFLRFFVDRFNMSQRIISENMFMLLPYAKDSHKMNIEINAADSGNTSFWERNCLVF